MWTPRKPLSRRTLLRGLVAGSAVAVALPPLEIMLGVNGEALADGEALPTRFGLWFWGNGVKPDRWVPPTQGDGWSPSSELAPLAGLVPYVSVVSGCEIKTATHPHHSGMTGILTGMPYHQLGTTRDTIVSTFAGPSVDQVAADWIGGATPFRSVELGVTAFRGTDEGSTFEHLSHNGPNQPNPSEYDPGAVFRRLFGMSSEARLDLARQSVLDAVGDQVTRLQARLGAYDRQRLDQHLESIRALEQRLGEDLGGCGPEEEPSAVPDVAGQEQIEAKNERMSELCALALACDLTRVFSIQFSTCGSGVIVWQVGATDGLHSTCHFEAGDQPTVHAAVGFEMSQLAAFLTRLRDTPEGAGNLLDRCAILCTTELTDGLTHANTDFPILVAGLANGRLRGGHHYRSPSAENTSKAVLSVLRASGAAAPSFGSDGGYVTDGIGAIEA